MPLEISQKGFSHWEDAPVGYFLDRKFCFPFEKTQAEENWSNVLEDVVYIDNAFFIFKSEAMDEIIAGNQAYNFLNVNFVVCLWVKLYDVSLELWTEEYY